MYVCILKRKSSLKTMMGFSNIHGEIYNKKDIPDGRVFMKGLSTHHH
jgi:hypothetical protein